MPDHFTTALSDKGAPSTAETLAEIGKRIAAAALAFATWKLRREREKTPFPARDQRGI